MAVYVSENRPCRFGKYTEYAYLLADTDEELHKFAGEIGLKRAWHQGPPEHKYSHYDLFGGKIAKARNRGAQQIKIRDYIREKTK